MEITTFETDSSHSGPIEFSGSLSADEASTLARGVYQRVADALHVDEYEARKKMEAMLTDKEFQLLAEETVKARACDRAIQTLGLVFVLAPSINSCAPYKEGQPYSFEATVHPVPSMELDLVTPINAANNTNIEDTVRRTLRARLSGTIPATLERAAVQRAQDEFQRTLKSSGETYREYRIRTGKKPQDVDDEVQKHAMRDLYEEIALETVFRTQSLKTTSEDESDVLSEKSPDHQDALRKELNNAGKLWMLAQKTRRHVALQWVMDNLVQS